MVAPATSTTDSVACTMSSALRAKVEWSPMLRADPRNASAGSVRVASHAGAAPKIIPVTSATANANSSTMSDGAVLMGRKCELRNASASSSRAAANATTSPASPPPIASRTLSVRACLMICRRVAPTANRTAVWVRRATIRASSRFATLAHAINNTSPQTASSICRLRPYSSFITATPAPAGTTLITCLGRSRSISDSQLAGYWASCISHWRNIVVSRGEMPAIEAPGRNRPITRSQAEMD